jgi:hypothetical protein
MIVGHELFCGELFFAFEPHSERCDSALLFA